jgi:hypothetical protein
MKESYFKWLRLVTPIFLGLVVYIVQDIRTNVIKMEDNILRLIERMAIVETKVDLLNGKRTDRENLSSLRGLEARKREVVGVQGIH